MPQNAKAAEIRARLPEAYGHVTDDAALLEDYAMRGRSFVPTFDRERFIKDTEAQTGYKFKRDYDSVPGGLWTGAKSAVNSFGFGLPSMGYKLATGDDLISNRELVDNEYYAMGGNVLGSIAGLGKLSLLGKGGKYLGGKLAAKLAKNMVRAENAGDIAGKMIGGGILGVDQEDERQRLEKASNDTSVLEGNTALAKAIAAGGGMALGVPMHSLHGAGFLPKKMLEKPLTNTMANLENVITGIMSKGGTDLSAQAASGQEGRAWDDFRTKEKWLMPGLFMAGFSPNVQNRLGQAARGSGRAWDRGMDRFGKGRFKTGQLEASQARANAAADPDIDVDTEGSTHQGDSEWTEPERLGTDAEYEALRAAITQDRERFKPLFDNRAAHSALQEVEQLMSKPLLSGNPPDIFGKVMVDTPQGVRQGHIFNPNPDAHGKFWVQFGQGQEPEAHHLSKFQRQELDFSPGEGFNRTIGNWEKGVPPQNFRYLDKPEGWRDGTEHLATLLGHETDSAGNVSLGIHRPGHPIRLYKQGEDLQDPRLLRQFADSQGKILSSKDKPYVGNPDEVTRLTDKDGNPYTRPLVDVKKQSAMDRINAAIAEGRRIRDYQDAAKGAAGRPSPPNAEGTGGAAPRGPRQGPGGDMGPDVTNPQGPMSQAEFDALMASIDQEQVPQSQGNPDRVNPTGQTAEAQAASVPPGTQPSGSVVDQVLTTHGIADASVKPDLARYEKARQAMLEALRNGSVPDPKIIEEVRATMNAVKPFMDVGAVPTSIFKDIDQQILSRAKGGQ